MTKADTSVQVAPNGPAATPAEPRGARRKRRTRGKLMRSAMRLMAERGMEGVTINEITDDADVGFGSFYNHFASKDAIYEALIEEVFDAFGRHMRQIAELIDDPAVVMAASIRYTLNRAESDPVWGRFLVRTGFSNQLQAPGLGQHLLSDLKSGVAQSRFSFDDHLVALVVVGGSVLAAVTATLEFSSPGTVGYANAKRLGLNTKHLPERTAAAVLSFLGIPADEASEIARLPLPDVQFSEEPFQVEF